MATNYTITSRPSFPHSRDMIRGARKDQKQMDTPVNNPTPVTAPAADPTPVEAPAAPVEEVVAAPVDVAPAADPAPVEAPGVDPISDTPIDAAPAADPIVVAPVEDAALIFDSWSPSYAADSEIVEATITEDIAPVVDETPYVAPATITIEDQEIRQPSVIIQDMEDLADELATYIIHMSDNYPSDNIEILTDTFSDLAKAVRELKKLCS